MLFSHIVAAYDGSDESKKALDYAVRIQQLSPNSKLDVVHVFQVANFIIGESVVTAPARVENDYYNMAEAVVAQAKKHVGPAQNADVHMLQGIPARTILDFADDNKADVIVIGSRGLSAFREFVLGSVSHNVVQNAKIPVLIIK